MAKEDKRIDQLPGGSVYPENLLVMDQNGTAVQITLQQLLQFVANGWGEQIVKYVAQTPTEEQQNQARRNIRCGSVGEVSADCVASGNYANAEGHQTKATGNYSHTEGCGTTASNSYAHAEGRDTTARGSYAHAENANTTASGQASHAEGRYTRSDGAMSHAEGYNTHASRAYQHVEGAYNVVDDVGSSDSDKGKYVHIVGNGTAKDARSNAHTLDWGGVAWFQGRVQCGGNAQDDGAQTVMLNGDTEVTLTDRTTGVKYNLYIDNGKLMMEEVL